MCPGYPLHPGCPDTDCPTWSGGPFQEIVFAFVTYSPLAYTDSAIPRSTLPDPRRGVPIWIKEFLMAVTGQEMEIGYVTTCLAAHLEQHDILNIEVAARTNDLTSSTPLSSCVTTVLGYP
ncbi:hypothetical protein AMECASPLE_029378 [Ameca splendens]|uniref:Uncharacterized protein n=1 Tax=Ameca splendens TaxID=208324 RepID=A0ABV0ZQM0_9TELE